MSRARGASGLDRSRALLNRLGWGFTSERLTELIEQGVREELALSAFLELLAESEASFREEKRMKGWLKQSHLPIGKTLESFDFLFNHSIDREKVDMLATCEFVRRKETVLLLGPPGTGKTHIATALGVNSSLFEKMHEHPYVPHVMRIAIRLGRVSRTVAPMLAKPF